MIIYRGGVKIFDIKDFKVVGKFMEIATLDCSVKSPTPIEFKVGDYVVYEYNNLTYSLYDVPTPKKQARSGSYGEAFIYDLKFKSDMEQLSICPFLDMVANDNGVHYTTLPSFSTFENVYGIAARIQANMDYLYSGKWRIVVASTSDAELSETLNEAKDYSISGQSCLEGLKKIYETWGVGFIHTVENGVNVITIGKSAGTTSLFRYGKGQGLRTIKKSLQNTDQFCTRVYAYGSTRNIPARWYNEKGYIGEAQYAPHLMIPPSKWVGGQPQGAYIDVIFDGENRVEKYGLRIKTFSYDGSGSREEIYPSIEKVTAGDIRAAKSEIGEAEYIPSGRYSDAERMDMVLAGSAVEDDGIAAEAGYKLYSEKLVAEVAEVTKTEIIAEPITGKPEKYVLQPLQETIAICSFNIEKPAVYRVKEILDMVVLTKNDLESTINAAWYVKTPNGGYISLNKSVTFTDTLEASLQLPEVNINITDKGVYTLVLRLEVIWDIDYVVPQIDGDIALTYTIKGSEVEMARGARNLDAYFDIQIKQIGFDLNSVTASDGSFKTISFKTGMCAGRSFVITQCKYTKDNDSWLLTCKRTQDSSVSQAFPNNIFQIASGDQFVLLNINMPDLYVYTAMQRLYNTALADLKHYSNPQFVVSPEVDNLQMARSPQILKEGMYMPIEDADIDINDDILIDGVTIIENGKELRKFDVTLRNDKIYNRFSKIATSISSLEKSVEDAKKNSFNTPISEVVSEEVMLDSTKESNKLFFWDEDTQSVRTKYDLIIEKSITFGGNPEGGDGEGSGSQVGITSFDVFVGNNGPYSLKDGKVNLPAYPTVPKSLPNPYKLIINSVEYDGSAPVEIEIKAGVDDTQLADYAKKEWVKQQGYLTELLAQSTYQPKGDYVTSADMGSALKGKQDTITDLAAIRSGAALGATALQEHQDISHLLSKTEASKTYQPLGDYALLDDLNSYLTKSSAKATYATIAALNAAIADHDTLREDFDALNTLINANASEYIDTWNEVKNFLDGYSDSDDLATILAGINADIAKRAKQTDLNSAVTRIGTLESTLETEQSYIDILQGYFTSGKANRAIADGNGNNIVDTYATKVALSSTNTNLNALSKEFSEFKELINSLWYLDPDHANTVRTKLNVVVEQAISFGGYGESDGTGGVGGLTSFKVKVGSTTYTSVGDTVSIPAYPVIPTKISAFTNDVNYAYKTDIPSLVGYAKLTDIPSLEGYAKLTDIPSLDNYATKGTTLSHYGITDAYTKTQVDNKLVNYLTTNTAQTVLASGAKIFKGAYGENIYIGGTKSGVTIDINAASGGYARALSFINSASDASGYVLFGAYGNSASGFQSAYIGVGEQDYNNAILNIYTDRIAVAGAASFSGLTTHSAGLKIGTTSVTEKTQNSTKYVEIDGNLVVTGAISFGGFGEGGSTGGGITSVTKDMVIDALGYTPYNATNPNGYITASAIPTSLKNPYGLTIYNSAGAAQVSYDGSAIKSLTLTKAMVGLGNVENTALSAWTGSSKITTLGTITSGTWNGAKIANSYLANSSITISGTSVSLGGSITQASLRTALELGSLAYKSSLVASDIPSLDWSKITSGKPTTLSGYGITDALGINGTAADSNKLGGKTAEAYARFSSEIFNGDYKHIGYSYARNIEHTGPVIAFGASASYYAQIAAESGFLYFRQYYNDHWLNDGWNQLAFTTSNVASATKLKNSRTLWGQSFDGTSNVTGYLNSILNPIYPTSDVLAVNIEAVVATLNYAHIYVSNKTGSNKRPLVLQYGYGNVGIGVEQPSYKLDVQGATRISDSNGSGVVIANQGNTIDGYYNGISGNLYLNNYSAGNVYLVTGGGNVGIGTNSPSSKLHIAGDITLSDTTGSASKSYKLKFLRRTTTDDYWDFGMYAQSTKGLTFYQSANSVDTDIAYLTGEGNFVVNGSITFGSASDRRLKDNIKSMTDKQAVAVLKALNPVTFKWNSTAYELGKLSGISDGFIADEYEKLIPNSGRDIWANYRAINHERVSGYLVKGWQNHETRLERAERRIKELEKELKQYRRA